MKVGILGAGPAGLFAAWLLDQRGADVTVFEARPYVGGISRSLRWHDFTCDLGAHRLFTQDEAVLRHLLSLVPMGRHIRRSRLYLSDKWIHDPVNVVELLGRYFPVTATRIILSYLFRPHLPANAEFQPVGPERQMEAALHSFDDYVEHRYGAALNQFFFRPYTEKMFGLPGSQISADWARRKIRIAGPFDFLRQSSKRHFSYFYYPVRGGYGSIPDRLYRDIRDRVRLSAPVRALEVSEHAVPGELPRVETVVYEQGDSHHREAFDHVISTVSLTILGRLLGREFPPTHQGERLVYLLINRPVVSDNHWLYFMDKNSATNRLVEFKNLSAVDQPPDQTVLCAEVTSQHTNLEQKVIDDVVRAGLVRHGEILDSMVLHEGYGYAVYDLTYASRLASVQQVLAPLCNLHLLGRSAEFEHLEVDDIYANALALSTALAPTPPPRLVASKAGDVTMQESSQTRSGQALAPQVYTVVLTFNHYDDTRECLESLTKIDYENMRVVVVDNGSSDGTPGKVRADFPDTQVIETGRNLGVPWGFNVGFSHALRAGAEYILMLNNDTIVDPQMLDRLLEAGQDDPQAGILVPKILYYDDPDVVWSAGGRYRTFPPAHVSVGQDRPSADLDRPFFLEYALSCGLLIHRRAFERVGLFDPGYFFFFDDWDFSHRVRTHGLHIEFVPEARMWHKISKSTRATGKEVLFWKVWGESSTRYYRRHGRPVFISLPVHVGYLMARELVKGNGKMLKHFWVGVREGLSKPLGPFPTTNDMILPIAPSEYE